MYRKHEESPLGVYNSSKLSSATKAGQGEMEKPLGDVHYLIQSLLTVAMPPEAYPSKLQIATPASKTNIHTHKKNYKTTTKSKEPPQQKCYNSNTLCLYVLKETDIMIKQAQNKIQSRTVHNTESLLGLQRRSEYVFDPRNETVRRVCAICMSVDKVRVYMHEKTGGDLIN